MRARGRISGKIGRELFRSPVLLCTSDNSSGGIPVQKLAEYERHAAECRQMGARTSDPVQKKQYLDMADAWAMLARERAKHLAKGSGKAPSTEAIVGSPAVDIE
jgi:hypothetical protein